MGSSDPSESPSSSFFITQVPSGNRNLLNTKNVACLSFCIFTRSIRLSVAMLFRSIRASSLASRQLAYFLMYLRTVSSVTLSFLATSFVIPPHSNITWATCFAEWVTGGFLFTLEFGTAYSSFC